MMELDLWLSSRWICYRSRVAASMKILGVEGPGMPKGLPATAVVGRGFS